MSVVRIPPTLRAETGGEREVLADGETVRDILDDLTSRFPGLQRQLDYANVYVSPRCSFSSGTRRSSSSRG